MPHYRVRPLFGVLVATSCLTWPARSQETAVLASVRVVVRAECSNPTTAKWSGSIQLDAGRVVSTRVLEIVGGQSRVVATEAARIQFEVAPRVSWCALEFVVEAPPQALMDLDVDGHRLQTRLVEILDGSEARLSWDGWVRLRRDTADILGIKIDRPHLVFAPAEEAKLEVEFNLLGAESGTTAAQVTLELRPVRSSTSLFSRLAELQLPTNAAPLRRELQIRTPNTEGAYDLVLRVEPEGGKPVERIIQFVVVDSNVPADRPAELVTELLDEIDPSQPATAGARTTSRRLMARTSRLGQFLWRSVRRPFNTHEPAPESPVLSSRLKIQHPGRPHQLSIDYDSKSTSLLAASVHEQDPDDRWIQIPQTSGVKLAEASASDGLQTHQTVFWPQTNSPSLGLSVVGSGGLGAVKRVRVHELPRGFPSLAIKEPENGKRLLGLFLDSGDAWSNWGSSRVLQPSSSLVIEDWQTFLAAAEHATEYARFAGYNCVAVTVASSGATLYPSSLQHENHRLDSGSLADSAPDPMRKDVVELMLRACERTGLGLVPCLRLDGAIASLEAKLHAGDPQASGIVLVTADGKMWESPSPAGAARRYNPLNSDVQAAVLDVVREFVQRYASRPSFEALAIDLGATSHLTLPGAECGYDDRTVEQFLRETSLSVLPSPDDDPGRFARRHHVLTTTAREQWNAWRGRRLATLYQSILAELQRAKPGARLVLNLTTLGAPGSDELRDAQRSARSAEDLLRSRGIDLRNWSVPRDIIVLRPFAATGGSPEAVQLNSSRELDELMNRLPSRGGLCLHEPEVLYLAAPEKGSDARGEAITVTLSAPGRSNLRWLAHSLAGADCQAFFEGGSAVAFGQEQNQREFARVFRSLPANEFRAIETLQPVTVRSFRDLRDTYIYLVNEASYSVEASPSFACATRATLTNCATDEKLSVKVTEHGLSARLTLEPFQTVALRLSGPDASVAECRVTVPQSAERGLKVRFDRLTQAMAVLGRDASRTLDGLPPNGDFEVVSESGDAPARWTTDGDSAISMIDQAIMHEGSNSLRLTGSAADSIVSDEFAPATGHALAMNVWLRGDRPGLKVRWFLIGKRGDESIYRCYADVPLQSQWEQKQFRARDLPEGQLDNLQVRFQLLGEGSVWIDDAQVCVLPISKDEQRAITKSVSAIRKAWKDRRLSDFERLADGYWANYLIESVESVKEE